MLEWVYRAADAVDRQAKSDPVYQELAQRQRELVGEYAVPFDTARLFLRKTNGRGGYRFE